jgi:DNA-binding GntR family transcriptional regulator
MFLIVRQRIYSSNDSDKNLTLAWKQHEEIVDSIRSRNKERANALLEKHLNIMREAYSVMDDYVHTTK